MRKNLTITFLFLLLLALPSVAFASACSVTTIDLLVGTTCSIGDKTFNFTSYSPTSLNQPVPVGSAIVFTPDTSNPLAPSFTLSSALFNSSGSTDESWADQYAYLYFDVAATAGNITGVTAVINNGETNSESSSSGYKPQGNLYVQVSLNGAAQMYSVENQYNDYGVQYGPYPSGAVSSIGNTASGFAYFDTDAEAVASASMDSVTYTFDESAATTPEPSALGLLACGMAALVGITRHKLEM